MVTNTCAQMVKHLVVTDSRRPESAGRTGESLVLIETDCFDSYVDILSTLKLLINLPHSVTQIPCCHNVPYIFDMGAIFTTWVFQLYEKLKRTRGGREWEMEGRSKGGGLERREQMRKGSREGDKKIKGDWKGFTVRETNVRGDKRW